MLLSNKQPGTQLHLVILKTHSTSITIREKLKEKRNLRKQWQHHRSPIIKIRLNKAVKDLQKLLHVEKM